MGLYLSIYVGPYAEARGTATERETNVYGCTNEKCAEWKKRDTWQGVSSPFCAACGSKTGKTTKMMKHRPSPYEALGENERLSPIDDHDNEGTYYFISNVRGTVGESLGGERGEDHHVDLSDVDREAQMKEFETQFAEEIALLRKSFEVDVCWGLQVYWR